MIPTVCDRSDAIDPPWYRTGWKKKFVSVPCNKGRYPKTKSTTCNNKEWLCQVARHREVPYAKHKV